MRGFIHLKTNNLSSLITVLNTQILLTGLCVCPLEPVGEICWQSSKQCRLGDTFLNSHNLSYDYADTVKGNLIVITPVGLKGFNNNNNTLFVTVSLVRLKVVSGAQCIFNLALDKIISKLFGENIDNWN